jgi:hypothetical protein
MPTRKAKSTEDADAAISSASLVRLKTNRNLIAGCDPASYYAIATAAANISITNVSCVNVNPNWPYCAYIPKASIVKSATDEITKRSKGNYTQNCAGCTAFPLADFNKSRKMKGHATVFIKRNGTIVDRPQADCQIDFDYSFDLVINGAVGLCFPANLRSARKKNIRRP